MHRIQAMIIGIPMNPIVHTECSVIVLSAIESVTFAEAQIRHKLST
jgi:hypothetical protein